MSRMSSLTVSQYYSTLDLRSPEVISSLASPDLFRNNTEIVSVPGLGLDPFNGVIMNLFSFPSPFVVALRENIGGSTLVAVSPLVMIEVLPFL